MSVSTRLEAVENSVARKRAAESFQALLYLMEDTPGVFRDLEGNVFQNEKEVENFREAHGNPVVIIDDIERQSRGRQWNTDGSRRSDGGQYARD